MSAKKKLADKQAHLANKNLQIELKFFYQKNPTNPLVIKNIIAIKREATNTASTL